MATRILPTGGWGRADFDFAISGALETYSEHPVAQAVTQSAYQQGLSLLPVQAVQATAGQGIEGRVNGRHVRLGKFTFVTHHSGSVTGPDITSVTSVSEATEIDPDLQAASQRLEKEGKIVIWVSQQPQVVGLLAVAD